jgi:hypothetical protein
MKLWQRELASSDRHVRPRPSCLGGRKHGVMELSERALNVECLFLW